MRIAFVNHPWDDADPRRREGSLPIWTWEVGRWLASEHEVHVFGRALPSGPRVRSAEGLTYHGIDLRPDRPLLRLARAWPTRRTSRRPHFARRLYHLAYAWQVARRCAALGCELIHVHNFSNFVPTLRRANPQARIVLHMHCEWLSQIDPALLRPRLAQVSAIVGCSRYVVERIVAVFPELAERCAVVPNGVDAQRFANGSPDGTNGHSELLFVGRVSPEKGVHTLLEAFALLARKRDDCRLRIVGPLAAAPAEFIARICEPVLAERLERCYRADYHAALRAMAESCGPQRVELSGPRPHEQLPQLYRRARVLINPSLSEAFGMSLIEAMAAGRPVVATRVGGMTEIVADGQSGLLVQADRPQSLAQAIERLLDDPALCEQMGRTGQRHVQRRYTWQHVCDALCTVYEGLKN